MTYTPYLTVDSFIENSLGVDLSDFGAPELDSVVTAASVMVDSETRTTWQYQTRVNEQHDWRGTEGKSWEEYPNFRPIRTVTSFEIAVSLDFAGNYVTQTVPVTPVQGQTTASPSVTTPNQAITLTLAAPALAYMLVPGQTIVLDFGTASQETVTVSSVTTSNSGGITTVTAVTCTPTLVHTAPFPVSYLASGVTPQVFGQVFVDSRRGFLQTVYFLIRYGLFAAYPSMALDPPQALLTYTCGYDNGTLQADGYSVPFPQWLVEATRICAAALAAERLLGNQGMGGLEQLKTNDVLLRRGTGSLDSSLLSVPPAAKQMLAPYRRITMRG